jgi:hypothetical protein
VAPDSIRHRTLALVQADPFSRSLELRHVCLLSARPGHDGDLGQERAGWLIYRTGFRGIRNYDAEELDLPRKHLVETGQRPAMLRTKRGRALVQLVADNPDNYVSSGLARVDDYLSEMLMVGRPELNLDDHLAASVIGSDDVRPEGADRNLPPDQLKVHAELIAQKI